MKMSVVVSLEILNMNMIREQCFTVYCEQLLCLVAYFSSFIGMDLNNKLESVEHEMRLVYNAMLKPQ